MTDPNVPGPDTAGQTTNLTTETAALAGELFAEGVGAQAGPPTTPATGTGTAGQAAPGGSPSVVRVWAGADISRRHLPSAARSGG